MEGGNLHEYIKSTKIGEDEAAKIIEKLLDAVSYLHRNKIIHRDIKPRKNTFFVVLLSSSFGLTRIVDFKSSWSCLNSRFEFLDQIENLILIPYL